MLSVVIATHDCERALVLTLAPLVAGAAEGVIREVIVADAGSSDQTAAVADMAGCRLLVSSGSIAVRLGAAIASAQAPWLMILRPGVVLDATWTGELSRFMAESEASAGRDVRAAVFRAAQRGNGARRAAATRPGSRDSPGALLSNRRLPDRRGLPGKRFAAPAGWPSHRHTAMRSLVR